MGFVQLVDFGLGICQLDLRLGKRGLCLCQLFFGPLFCGGTVLGGGVVFLERGLGSGELGLGLLVGFGGFLPIGFGGLGQAPGCVESLGQGRRVGGKFADLLAVGGVPNGHAAIPFADDDALAIMGEHCLEGDAFEAFDHSFLFAVLIPNFDLFVPADGDEVAVVVELYGECAATVGGPVLDLFAVDHCPQSHGTVLAGGGKHVGVESPTQPSDVVFVTVERIKKIAGERFPNVQAAIAVAGGQQHGVGRKGNGHHPVRMFLDVVQRFAGGQLEHLDTFTRAAEGDGGEVGHHVGGEHGVVFLAERHALPAGFNIPRNHATNLATSSASGDEQLAVAAEGK